MQRGLDVGTGGDRVLVLLPGFITPARSHTGLVRCLRSHDRRGHEGEIESISRCAAGPGRPQPSCCTVERGGECATGAWQRLA